MYKDQYKSEESALIKVHPKPISFHSLASESGRIVSICTHYAFLYSDIVAFTLFAIFAFQISSVPVSWKIATYTSLSIPERRRIWTIITRNNHGWSSRLCYYWVNLHWCRSCLNTSIFCEIKFVSCPTSYTFLLSYVVVFIQRARFTGLTVMVPIFR